MINAPDRDEIVYSRLSEQIIEGIPDLLSYMESIHKITEQIDQEGRARLLDDYAVHRLSPRPDESELAAVDSSAVIQSFAAVTILMGCAMRYGQGQPECRSILLPMQDSLYGIQMPALLRLVLELDLLSVVQDYTIMDNSFWSVLLNANKLASDLFQNELPIEGMHYVQVHLCSQDSSLYRAVSNPSVISMSKLNIADAITRSLGYEGIKDRHFMTRALNEDEYLAPIQLAPHNPNAHFGIHRILGNSHEIEEIYRSNLQVTYFRPWQDKPAYRIEFHEEAELTKVLSLVKASTQIPLHIEPESQFMADRLVKGAMTNLQLPIIAARQYFPHLIGAYRS